MKNKNMVILLSLGILILAVFAGSLLAPKSAPVIQKDYSELELDFEPSSLVHSHSGHLLFSLAGPAAYAEEETDEKTPAEPLSDEELKAYLLITVGGVTYSPIPLRQEGNYTIRQSGGEKVNVVHVTTDSVTMASSTCDNQLCVGEGTVTLENKETRILGGYIICLPNGVTLELYSAEEMSQLLAGQP